MKQSRCHCHCLFFSVRRPAKQCAALGFYKVCFCRSLIAVTGIMQAREMWRSIAPPALYRSCRPPVRPAKRYSN
jgi:hypothetical protein